MIRAGDPVTGRGGHHIAAVAHLFLGDQGPRPGAEGLAAGGTAGDRSAQTRRFLVVSAARDRLATHTAAALARLALATAGARGEDGGDSARIDWLDLGPASTVLLREVEKGRYRGSAQRSRLAPCEGLVWCQRRDDLWSLIAAHRLGRLCEVIKPPRVVAVAFPVSHSRQEQAAVDSEDLRRRRWNSLLRRAVGEIGLQIAWPGPQERSAVSSSASANFELLNRVAAALLGPAPPDAS